MKVNARITGVGLICVVVGLALGWGGIEINDAERAFRPHPGTEALTFMIAGLLMAFSGIALIVMARARKAPPRGFDVIRLETPEPPQHAGGQAPPPIQAGTPSRLIPF